MLLFVLLLSIYTAYIDILQEPLEIPLNDVYINCFSGMKRRKVLSTHAFLYIPLFDTLSQLLQNKEILSEVNNIRNNDGNMMRDYSDGSLYNNHPLFSNDG